MRSFNQCQQEFEHRRFHFESTGYRPAFFRVVSLEKSRKRNLDSFRCGEQPHGKILHFPNEPCVFAARQIKHTRPFFRNLEKDALKHESLGIVAHPMRFMRL